MIALLCLFLSLSFATPILAEISQYKIEATYLDQSHQIEGYEEITFFNNGPEPVSELYLFLYPNIYLEKKPKLDPDFYRNVYPVAFNPGGTQITEVKTSKGEILLPASIPSEGNEVIKIQIKDPILPQGRYRFSVRFTTTIPQKRGIFGSGQDLVTLQGGWHPYLAPFVDGEWRLQNPPPKSSFRIRFTLKKGLTLIGSNQAVLESAKPGIQTFLLEGENLPFFSLSIGRQLTHLERKIENIEITYHILAKDKRYAEQVQSVTEAALSFFLNHSGPLSPTRLNLVESYLYQDLVKPGAKLLYLSNRFFKVFPTLKRFHEASLARGLFQLLWRKKRPDEAWWVIECLARHDAEAFMVERHKKAFNLNRWLKPIGFIPLIDQILYSDTLPMRQVYFREATVPIVSEDVRFFNNPPSEGPNIFAKLRNLFGSPFLDRAISIYRSQKSEDKKTSFREALSIAGPQNANRWIDQWLSVRPKLDFEIAEIREKEVQGKHETFILVKKHGEGIEPLQILLHEKNGDVYPFIWDGEGEEHPVVLKTDHRIKKIELDPHKFTNDPDRLNNQSPQPWKVLLDQFRLNYDFQTRFLSYKAGLLFQRIYDTKNWINLLFSRAETGDFAHLGYTHTIKKNHRITTGFTYETLRAAQTSDIQEEAGFINLGYAFVFPDIPLLSESIQRLTTTFPAFNVGLIYNQQVAGGDLKNATLLRLDFRRTFPFSNYHEIGARIFIGQSVGGLFEESRFFLGGSNAMRGFTPLVFNGENMALFSAEYRFPLFYDTDINFLGLAHSHAWQGVIFADTGTVTDSHNVFEFNQYKSDVGAGIRFYADLFGVYPSILRIDVAVPIASPIESEKKPHYYLDFGHSF